MVIYLGLKTYLLDTLRIIPQRLLWDGDTNREGYTVSAFGVKMCVVLYKHVIFKVETTKFKYPITANAEHR